MSAGELTAVRQPIGTGLRVYVVGVGGAGTNLLSHGIDRGMNPNNCVAVNNDTGQLACCAVPNKVYLGNPVSESDAQSLQPRQVARFLQSSAQRVAPFTQGSDFTILVAGLGGVIGTGTAPVIAQSHRTQVKPVVAIVAIPFIHERERRFLAVRGLKKMVEACDCTIVVDNGIEREPFQSSSREADVTASSAMHTLSEILSAGGRALGQKILDALSIGDIATVCSTTWTHRDTIQSTVFNALRSPSAKMPLNQTRGAVLVYTGPTPLTTTQAAKAYETIVSMVGHNVRFVFGGITRPSEPRVSIFLSGYSYDNALVAFVDFIENIYDLEYGQDRSTLAIRLEIPLFEMEN
ncbi:MAG TPA: hypothetical protein VFE98_11025 [Candidatus Bathyarchaeia archaeon]|nr:hypothetical protein [Candidatus Bathyarchaeia archaeon]